MEIIAYYDKKTEKILEFMPEISEEKKQKITEEWNNPIRKKILQKISEKENINVAELKKMIGHSMSTLHENILRLENKGLIDARIIYEKNKQKVLKPKILFVTKNQDIKARLSKFFQGLWVDKKKSDKIIEFLKKNKTKQFTIEEISLKTKIPYDEVELLLNNWDSLITRSISDAFRKKPFEKKTYYKYKKHSTKQ